MIQTIEFEVLRGITGIKIKSQKEALKLIFGFLWFMGGGNDVDLLINFFQFINKSISF